MGAKKLGELLIETGLIDDFQLQSALSHQRSWGGKLGSILVELEFIREEDVAQAIAKQFRTPWANLFEPEIPEAALKMIKKDLVKKYNVVPVKKEPGGLVVAMSDPLDIDVIDALRFATGFQIKPALALESEIRDAIRKYYDHEEVVRKPPARFQDIAAKTPGEIEITHSADLTAKKRVEEPSPIIAPNEAAQQTMSDKEVRVDALISLLIEKGLISRDELVRMVYQKKMGL
jgi:Type II secretion system (T2SS), protein E, N-terminal domain